MGTRAGNRELGQEQGDGDDRQGQRVGLNFIILSTCGHKHCPSIHCLQTETNKWVLGASLGKYELAMFDKEQLNQVE